MKIMLNYVQWNWKIMINYKIKINYIITSIVLLLIFLWNIVFHQMEIV